MDLNTDTTKQEKTTDEKNPQSSNWLKDLGEQSWQAELVISGLVITGLFQMPDLFIKWAETSVIQSGEMEFMFLNFACLLFLVGIDMLIIFFGIHLLFRGIWIALLGLNSVYPDGINVESTKGLGKKYWLKMKEQYPDLMAYTVELDARCSLLFSSATFVIIMVSSFSIIILVFYQLIRFLTSFFPVIADNILPIGIGAYFLFLLLTLIPWYLGKKYPDNKKVEKFITGYGKAMGALFSLYIFRKPVGYINAIQTSNSKSKYAMVGIMAVSAIMGFVGGRQISESYPFRSFDVDRYFTFNNMPSQVMAFNYENLMDKEAHVYTPFIQSDIVTDDFLKVFIPTIARETERMNLKEYSFIERFKMNDAQREKKSKEKLDTYKQFNRIYINDVEYPNLDYQFYDHPQASERGLLVYVPSDSFARGRNILEIRKNYFSKDSVQKVVKIPFFFNSF
jgi:hypothetical protein